MPGVRLQRHLPTVVIVCCNAGLRPLVAGECSNRSRCRTRRKQRGKRHARLPLQRRFFVIGFAPSKISHVATVPTKIGDKRSGPVVMRPTRMVCVSYTNYTHFIHRPCVAIHVQNALSCSPTARETLHVGFPAKNPAQLNRETQALFLRLRG
ncbi:hypothetical protein ALP36_102252 [Pseudomonas syringae pv. coriandricola]|uniref:Uncharacterized protein n=1 Tax=Pseudomonas syringae pv. coriandricola TaxID=264453 RepID=A0A3M5R0G6_9PSED|nr:Unknown protein sequence [Pseudomonas syringae pv. maculicola str. M6]KPX71963.1 hypothetical protein ALO84_101791 [Pseudomonas syringae pv. maculicola]RMO84779.1 hypothetical protein ALQ34_102884 [Pseudomonas syringae pv. maculicola]RMR32032.1 hypothetical protein ALP87_102178 [Pseudomonas syringae pv. coriandricola]RMU02555.1 hypothetical protein ALP36_102252 [Pseudomonas syringae pv. coriandricola]